MHFEIVKMEYSDKQKQIMSTAERLFSEKGYEGTSVRDIAEEAGVNIAMISYYFGSKEKLMEALFEQRNLKTLKKKAYDIFRRRYGNYRNSKLRTPKHIKLKVESLLRDDESTPMQKAEALADDYINRIMDKHGFFKIMLCEQLANKNAVIINCINDLKKRNAEEFGKLIKDGQQKGAFKKDVDVLLLMNTLIGSVTQMMMTMHYYREYHKLTNVPDNVFYDIVRQNLSVHLKFLFKALLSYEA